MKLRIAAPTVVPSVRQDTSIEAAAWQSASGKAGRDEARVLDFIRATGGVTDDEIEIKLSLLHQTASARRRGLVLKGLVEDSGVRRLTRNKRKAIVWRPVSKKAANP